MASGSVHLFGEKLVKEPRLLPPDKVHPEAQKEAIAPWEEADALKERWDSSRSADPTL